MQVAFLADALYQNLAAGSARYSAELIHELCQIPDIKMRLLTLYPPETVAQFAHERQYPEAESIPLASPRRIQYLLWHLAGLAGPIAKVTASMDVIHTPILLVPPKKRIHLKPQTPLVVSVFDMSIQMFPQHHTRQLRLFVESGLRRAVQDADAFVAISENTKRDLVRLTGVPPSRVFVTPLAAEARFTPRTDNGALARYGIEPPYILYVGTLEPRKNIGMLLRAFAALKDIGTTLVLAGAKGWMYDELFVTLEKLNLRDRVKTVGFVANDDLPILYSQAQAFIYPSLFEGFGLPVLEAMQCGTPVITTNSSSLPEVSGDAALVVSPEDTEGLANALARILSEPALRDDLRGRSLEQAARFSWRRTAELTAEVYHHVLTH